MDYSVGICCILKVVSREAAAPQYQINFYCSKCFLWDTIADEI